MAASHVGRSGALTDKNHQWGATLYGDKGTLKTGVYGYDFHPAKGESIHKDVTYEYEQFPEDRTEKDLERHVAPAVRYHMQNLLSCIDRRDKPVSDIEEGYISASSCILGNMALKLGRELHYDPQQHRVVRRRGGDAALAAAVSRALRSSGGGEGVDARGVAGDGFRAVDGMLQ